MKSHKKYDTLNAIGKSNNKGQHDKVKSLTESQITCWEFGKENSLLLSPFSYWIEIVVNSIVILALKENEWKE